MILPVWRSAHEKDETATGPDIEDTAELIWMKLKTLRESDLPSDMSVEELNAAKPRTPNVILLWEFPEAYRWIPYETDYWEYYPGMITMGRLLS